MAFWAALIWNRVFEKFLIGMEPSMSGVNSDQARSTMIPRATTRPAEPPALFLFFFFLFSFFPDSSLGCLGNSVYYLRISASMHAQ